jgi:predicted esterase
VKLAPLFIAAAIATSAPAQDAKPNLRYEIMWRMRELDHAWAAHTKTDERARALPLIERAMKSLSASEFGTVAQELDAARSELMGRELPYPRLLWPDCLSVAATTKMLDRGSDRLQFKFVNVYGAWDGRGWFLALRPGTSEGLAAEPIDEGEIWFEQNMAARSWVTRIDTTAAGDRSLDLGIDDDNFTWSHRAVVFSIVEHRDTRLAALDKSIAALPDKAPKLERATLGALSALLKSLAAGSTEETDYPAARLLGEAEQVAAAAAKGELWYGPAKIGQFWLALPTGEKQTTRVRVLVPQQIKAATPNDLVIALHGEGGSENTFFDTCGDGLIVKQCEMRGWLLVAPRLEASGNAPLSAIVDAMAAIYPVDRAHVFVVGHSSGALAGLDAVIRSPKTFRALAAFAAGRDVKESDALAEFPIYIAAGDHDPALSDAVLFNETLRAAGSKVAKFKIYPNCEHLMIAADALPDVFAWFSSLAH